MPQAAIVIEQTGYGPFDPGRSARGLELKAVSGESIYFSNSAAGDIGVTSWEWVLIEKPPTSAASLIGAATDQAELQADAYGRYIVSLRVNGMDDDTDGYAIVVASCDHPTLTVDPLLGNIGDWSEPALNEGTLANWTDAFTDVNVTGAQSELWRIVEQLRLYTLPNIGANMPGASRITFPFVTNVLIQHDHGGGAVASCIRNMDMSDFKFTNVYFCALLYLTDPATASGEAWLYDETNAAVITGSTVVTVAQGPTLVKSSALSVGSNNGDIRNDAPTMYSVFLRRNGVPGADYVSILDAYLEFD